MAKFFKTDIGFRKILGCRKLYYHLFKIVKLIYVFEKFFALLSILFVCCKGSLGKFGLTNLIYFQYKSIVIVDFLYFITKSTRCIKLSTWKSIIFQQPFQIEVNNIGTHSIRFWTLVLRNSFIWHLFEKWMYQKSHYFCKPFKGVLYKLSYALVNNCKPNLITFW